MANGQKQRWAIQRAGGEDGDGICSSSHDRSNDADAWWDSARSMGLTRGDHFDEDEEGVDLTYEARSALEGEEVDGDRRITHVSSAEGDVSKSVEVDVYRWTSVERAKLVVCEMDGRFEMPRVEEAWRELNSPDHADLVINVEPEWILACDVRGLSLAGINLLGVLAQVAGMSEPDLAGFRLRWELSLDPSEEIRQLPLSLTRNASRSRAAYRALERAEELRQATGWGVLATLP